jgi:hypothetical protein
VRASARGEPLKTNPLKQAPSLSNTQQQQQQKTNSSPLADSSLTYAPPHVWPSVSLTSYCSVKPAAATSIGAGSSAIMP